MLCYKYVVTARVDVLENSRIRFTQPSVLNDPFEARPSYSDFKDRFIRRLDTDPTYAAQVKNLDIESLLQSEEEKSSFRILRDSRPAHFNEEYRHALLNMVMNVVFDHTMEEQLKSIDENFALLSLSKSRTNPLMWSHYADSHSGFVIGFDRDSSFFKPGGRMANNGLCDVKYSIDRYVMPANGLEGLSPDEKQYANMGMFFTKSLDWSYEEEQRILAHPKYADCTLESPSGQAIHLYDFPPESVREVILGFRMPTSTITAIREICIRKYPQARLLNALPHEQKFAMKISPFDDVLNDSERRHMESFLSKQRTRIDRE